MLFEFVGKGSDTIGAITKNFLEPVTDGVDGINERDESRVVSGICGGDVDGPDQTKDTSQQMTFAAFNLFETIKADLLTAMSGLYGLTIDNQEAWCG